MLQNVPDFFWVLWHPETSIRLIFERTNQEKMHLFKLNINFLNNAT